MKKMFSLYVVSLLLLGQAFSVGHALEHDFDEDHGELPAHECVLCSTAETLKNITPVDDTVPLFTTHSHTAPKIGNSQPIFTRAFNKPLARAPPLS